MNYNNTTIRRQDRLLEEELGMELLKEGEYGFLAMSTPEGAGYGIPINYVWDGAEAIYLHCAPEGEKLRHLALAPNVTFTVVGNTLVVSSKFTTAYASILIKAQAHLHLPADERRHAIELILDKYSPHDKVIGMKYAEKSFHRTEIIRLDIQQVSGKRKVVAQDVVPENIIK